MFLGNFMLALYVGTVKNVIRSGAKVILFLMKTYLLRDLLMGYFVYLQLYFKMKLNIQSGRHIFFSVNLTHPFVKLNQQFYISLLSGPNIVFRFIYPIFFFEFQKLNKLFKYCLFVPSFIIFNRNTVFNILSSFNIPSIADYTAESEKK